MFVFLDMHDKNNTFAYEPYCLNLITCHVAVFFNNKIIMKTMKYMICRPTKHKNCWCVFELDWRRLNLNEAAKKVYTYNYQGKYP